jgi:DNA-binding transcriptional ArsR family regulator
MTELNVRELTLNHEDFATPEALTHTATAARTIDGPFLRGPIPWAWLHRAIDLAGPALLTGMAIWYFWYLNKQRPFQVSSKKLAQQVKLSQRSIQRGISLLRDAGLLKVTHRNGSRSTLAIIEDNQGAQYWDEASDD